MTDNLGACWVSPDSTAAALEPSQHSQSRAGLWCPGTAQLMHNSWARGMSLLQGTAGGTAVLPPEPLCCYQNLCAATRASVVSPELLCCHQNLCAVTSASVLPPERLSALTSRTGATPSRVLPLRHSISAAVITASQANLFLNVSKKLLIPYGKALCIFAGQQTNCCTMPDCSGRALSLVPASSSL